MSSRKPRKSEAPKEGALNLIGFDPKLVSLGRELEGVLGTGRYRLVSAEDKGDTIVNVDSRRGGTRSLLGCFGVEMVLCGDCGVNEHTPAGEVRLYRTGEVEALATEEGFKSYAYDAENIKIT
jgi:hypothetical protein